MGSMVKEFNGMTFHCVVKTSDKPLFQDAIARWDNYLRQEVAKKMEHLEIEVTEENIASFVEKAKEITEEEGRQSLWIADIMHAPFFTEAGGEECEQKSRSGL